MNVLPFWGGPFSNWHICQIKAVTIDSQMREFNCVEQFMMVQKALTFDDRLTARMILDEADPAKQKKLGRTVNGFDQTEWMCVCRSHVKPALVAKFTQNEELQRELWDTRGRVLVEASPYDKIWGVGMPASDLGISDPLLWKGLNFLGFLLTDLRIEMIGE